MKRTTTTPGRVLSAIILLLALSVPVRALEVGTDFSLSNLNFSTSRTPAETGFQPCYVPLEYGAYLHHGIDDGTGITLGFRSDRILKRMLYGLFSYSSDYYVLEGGPFFGLFNTAETPVNPGISAAVTLQIPGQVFLRLETTRNLALEKIFSGDGLSPGLSSVGDYVQEDSRFALGLYAGNTIVSFAVRSRLYTVVDADYGTVVDSLTDYTMATDIFQKNAPFKPMISFTYRSLSKNFIDAAPRTRHTAGSLVLGTRVDLTFHRHLTAYIDLESGFYTFGLDDLIGEFGGDHFFFTGSLGFRLNLDLLK